MAKQRVPWCSVFILFTAIASAGQSITSFNPSQGAQGSAFTLTVNGSGFTAPAQVQFLPGAGITVSNTTVVSPVLITAQVQVGAAVPLGPQDLIVSFRAGSAKAPGPFTVTAPLAAAVAPILTSVGPAVVSQDSQNVRLTLNGMNFRPGATVVISPPLPSASASTARLQAVDVVVQSVTQLSDRLLLAEISVGRQATPGVRGIDVVNADGASTGPTVQGTVIIPGSRTSKPLNVVSNNSLAAPLQVGTISLSYPRDGTVLTQGDDIYGEAVLAGAGNGLITGLWLWDGNPFEQFAVPMTGGASVRLKTTRALPAFFLGPHFLAVRVTSPNLVQTRDVTLVVNPGSWKLEKLFLPQPDAGFSGNALPWLQWAAIPAASHYQVGFAELPFYNSVERWYDVNAADWHVPQEVWNGLPEGQLYWTVRVVEISGETRKPAPMRPLWKLPANTLQPALANQQQDGRLVLTWSPMPGNMVYRVSIRSKSGSPAAHYFLTRVARLDLSPAQVNFLQPGQAYSWQVDALSNKGHRILAIQGQEFVARAATARRSPPRNARIYKVASAGPLPGPPQFSTQITKRSPGPGETMHDAAAAIHVDFSIKLNPADVVMTLDSADVTSLAQISDASIVLQPAAPLQNGEHQVIVRIGSDTDSWKFLVERQESAGTISTPQSDEEAAPAAEAALPNETLGTPPSEAGSGEIPATDARRLQESSGQLASNTQWISGQTPDTNIFSITNREVFHNGPWTAELNGSGLMNSVLGPAPQHALGRFNDYVLRLAYDREHWKGGFRFGVVAPVLYTSSEFVTTGSAREGVEASLGTPGGRFAFFANTNDNSLGGGIGLDLHQEIRGASYDAPVPQQVGDLRFMWLSARDTGAASTISFNPTGTPIGGILPPGSPVPTPTTPLFLPSPSAGDAYGALLLLKLGQAWNWTSEYSLSYVNPNLALATGRLFGRAWRSGVSGSWNKATMSFTYRDLGPNFGSPANPSLSLNSNPDRRGIDASVSRPFPVGTFTVNYQFLQSQVHSSISPRITLNSVTLGWSKDLSPTTVLQIGAREVRTTSGALPTFVLSLAPEQQLALQADLRDAGLNASISKHVSTVTLTLGGTRDWFRNRLLPQQDVITSGINVGANWQGGSFFQINSSLSVNWISAEKFTVGQTRIITTFIQPMLTWKGAGLSLSPLVAVSNNNTRLGTHVLTADSLTSEYVARLAWTMPRALKFSTLSLEGGQTHLRDAILNTGRTDNRLLLLWNMVWGYSRNGAK